MVHVQPPILNLPEPFIYMDTEEITVFECSIDHLTGEEIGQALEALAEMPAVLDVIFLTGIGKKNRAAGLLQTLCRPADDTEVKDAIFRHTHTLGLRQQTILRHVLPRSQEEIKIGTDILAAKGHVLDNETYMRPEADEIKRIARKYGKGAPAFRFRKRQRRDGTD